VWGNLGVNEKDVSQLKWPERIFFFPPLGNVEQAVCCVPAFCLSREIKCRIFHFWCHASTQQILDFGTFQILGFWIEDAQPVLSIFPGLNLLDSHILRVLRGQKGGIILGREYFNVTVS
jgi:hypothetical protein